MGKILKERYQSPEVELILCGNDICTESGGVETQNNGLFEGYDDNGWF